MFCTVDECKGRLSQGFGPEMLVNIDWLTEVVRRLSEKAVEAEPLTDATMISPMRLEQVRVSLSYQYTYLIDRPVEEARNTLH